MKNKSVHSCQFVHHAKFHCIMATLKKLFKVEFERGELEKSQKCVFDFNLRLFCENASLHAPYKVQSDKFCSYQKIKYDN